MSFNIPTMESKGPTMEELGNHLSDVARQVKAITDKGMNEVMTALPTMKTLLSEAKSTLEQIKQHPDATSSPAHMQLISMFQPTLDEYDQIVQQLEHSKN